MMDVSGVIPMATTTRSAPRFPGKVGKAVRKITATRTRRWGGRKRKK